MADKIKLVFLGTSSAVPTAKRNHPAFLLSYRGENILVDCGEGTQRQFRKAKLNPCKITKILITHWHADHVLGIPGLLKTLEINGYKKKLEIYGPRGTKVLMKKLLDLFGLRKEYRIEIDEVKGSFLETPHFYIEAEAMTHGTPCNAYSFVEKGRTRIDKQKLKKYGIKSGAHLKKLKEGKSITSRGKRYSAKNLTFVEEGRKISFVLDTSINKKIIPFVKNSNALVCESSFDSKGVKKAEDYKHLTSIQAANIAKKSNSKKLFLVHLSQKHDKNPEVVLKEAKKIFKNSSIPKDLDEFEI
jgi:ribonuclease Z